jgi:hypothetical protein
MCLAEPNEDFCSAGVDGAHETDLLCAFGDVGLVDTQGVDPNWDIYFAPRKFGDDGGKVRSYGQCVCGVEDEWLWILW